LGGHINGLREQTDHAKRVMWAFRGRAATPSLPLFIIPPHPRALDGDRASIGLYRAIAA